MTGIEMSVDLGATRAVMVVEDFGKLEQSTVISQPREFIRIDKLIIDSVGLITPLGSCRVRNGKAQFGMARNECMDKRCLAGTRRRSDNK